MGGTMKKHFLSMLLTAVAVLLSTQITQGASSQGQDDGESSDKNTLTRVADWKSSFSIINTEDETINFASDPNDTVDEKGATVLAKKALDEDKYIKDQCVDKAIKPFFITETIFAGVFDFIGDKVASYFIGKAEKKLSDILESYSDAYQASYSPDYFYVKSANPRELSFKCIRFVRTYTETKVDNQGETTDDKETKIAMEFIAQVALTESKSALKIRPLRLALFKSKTKSKGEKLALSIALRADSVWLRDGSSLSGEILNIQFPTQEFKGTRDLKDCNVNGLSRENKTECKRYNKNPLTQFAEIKRFDKSKQNIKNWTTESPLPLIPISDGVVAKGGDVSFTLSVAEAGNPPDYLEDLIAFFDSQKSDLESQLKDAFTSLLD